MKLIFAHANYPKNRISRSSLFFSYSVSGLIIVMLTAQLMTFEKFIPILENYQLSGGDGAAHLMAVLLVVSQWLALPFLLRMSLSPLFRLFSVIMFCVVPLLWLYLAFWVATMEPPLIGSGVLGGLFTGFLDGSELLLFSAVLSFLVVALIYVLRKDITIKH